MKAFPKLRFFALAAAAAPCLGLVLLASSVALTAQEPSSPSKAERVTSGNPTRSDMKGLSAQPGDVKDEEQEEHDLFRHTSLVIALSDAIFHDDKNATDGDKIELRAKHIEQTARILEWINATIILLCIIIPVARALPKAFRTRSVTLNQKLDEARKTTADANARLSAVEAQQSRLDEEIAKIRAQVEEESRQDGARIKAGIEEERARIVASAEQEISAAAAAARRSLRSFAADIAIEQAARQLVLTPETDRAVISEFIQEAQAESGNGANSAGRGGRQ